MNPGLLIGERHKAEAFDVLAATREVYINRGRRALLLRLLEVGSATADDVRAAVELPEDIDPRCLGVVPNPLATAKIIEAVGFAKSARPNRHASYIQVWTLLDRKAAVDWLAFHPDMPDPMPGDNDGFLFTMNNGPADDATGPQ